MRIIYSFPSGNLELDSDAAPLLFKLTCSEYYKRFFIYSDDVYISITDMKTYIVMNVDRGWPTDRYDIAQYTYRSIFGKDYHENH